MKKRDKALRLPTIRRLHIAVTASSNVRSGCSAISANNQPACFSNGETLPPLGFAAELPSSLQRRSQLITELGLTSRSAATSCREAPPSTIAIARTRRSFEYGLAITLSFQKESGAPDSPIRRPLGIPRFEPGGICSSRASIGPDYPDLPRAEALHVSPAFCECAGDQRSIVRGNRLAFVRVDVRQGQSR
jgi:hypothetical protein